jgi:hypothetical protein
VFSRTDVATNSEGFYNSILDLLYDEDEQEESKDLLAWWNRYISASCCGTMLMIIHSQADISTSFVVAASCCFE